MIPATSLTGLRLHMLSPNFTGPAWKHLDRRAPSPIAVFFPAILSFNPACASIWSARLPQSKE
jgi:hypothetical protein